jgi:hypothetical protein
MDANEGGVRHEEGVCNMLNASMPTEWNLSLLMSILCPSLDRYSIMFDSE